MKIESRASRALLAMVAIVGVAALAGCSKAGPRAVGGAGADIDVDGGPIVERTRDAGGVSGVILATVGQLHIQQGSVPTLRIRAAEQLHQYIRTDVVGATLVIQFVDGVGFQSNSPIEYYLTVPDLQYVELSGVGAVDAGGLRTAELALVLSGVGNFDFSGLDVNRLAVTRSGDGDLRLSGVAQHQAAALGGMGDYLAGGLSSRMAGITIDGGGSATVQVRDRLDATINGSGSVYYLGNPFVERSGSGSGTVERIG